MVDDHICTDELKARLEARGVLPSLQEKICRKLDFNSNGIATQEQNGLSMPREGISGRILFEFRVVPQP